MAYDEGLAHRVHELLENRPGFSEKKMFGGLCFLVDGNMAGGIIASELMLRVGPDMYDECLALEHAREMDFTGRALKGMIYVGEEGIAEDEDLEAWVERGYAFAASLPPKQAKQKKSAKNRKAGTRPGAS